jgi:gliding motility-associated-like protein
MQASIDKTTGNRTLLIENNGKASLLQLDNTGQLSWQKSYQTTSGAFPPNCFSTGKKGFNIFMSNNRSKQYRLLVTDQQGIIDCFNEPGDISVISATLNLGHDSVVTKTNYNLDSYYDYAYPLKRDENYPVEKLTECQQTLSCCTDFIDRTNIPDIHICAGSDYTLPDGSLVSDSGLYNVTYKTAGGCDSIRYYKITVDKDVKDLTLGKDTCLNGGSSFNISATAGYQKYFWMKSDVATGSKYKVSRPGMYEVMVENACGLRSDSIEIFELCDYPLYMPNAFTPNGDGVNDVFRVPALNKNNLVRLTVYNRWGQVYFQTKNPAQGWNGRFKQQEAEGGVYIYYLEMSGLSGHRLVEKGTIMLIR